MIEDDSIEKLQEDGPEILKEPFLQHKLDWSQFLYGMTIDTVYHQAIYNLLGRNLSRGESFPIKLLLDGQVYYACFECPDIKNRKDTIVRLMYKGKNNNLGTYLHAKFHNVYAYIKNIKDKFGGRYQVKLPNNLQYMLYLSETSTPFVYRMTYDKVSIISHALQEQLDIFLNMKRATIEGLKAPHKPVLMLSIIELFEKYGQAENKIMFDEKLKDIFSEFWNLYVKRKALFKCNPNLPFHHLDANIGTSYEWFSPPYMTLNDSLFSLLQDSSAREIMKRHLITMIN